MTRPLRWRPPPGIEVLSSSRTEVDELWDEVARLRAELADEKAAHAKTISNFEEYVEATR